MNVRRGRTGDRGVVLVIAALCMLALLLIVAIVIDLGYTRSDRRAAQLAADNAASSAGITLADPASDPSDACEVAIEYLEISLEVSSFTFEGGETCTKFAGPCDDATIRTLTGSAGQYEIEIVHPVPNGSPLMARTGTISAANVPSSAEDGTPCQRIGVKLTTTGGAFFGGVAGSDDRVSGVHAVAKGNPDPGNSQIPAFLMLERVDCGVLVENNADGITVRRSTDGTDPGLIHADSFATGDCGGSTKGYVVYGTANSAGQPSIVLESTNPAPPEEAKVGHIYVVADNGKEGAVYPAGLNVDPEGGSDPISRAVVDAKYNTAPSAAITDMHLAASTALTQTPPADYIRTNGCNLPLILPPKLFVNNCNNFSGSHLFPGVTHIVFERDVSAGNNQALVFTNATEVTIRGKLAIAQGSAMFPAVRELSVGDGVSVGTGQIGVNSLSSTACVGGTAPSTKFVVFASGQAMQLNGLASFCSTTVYLAGPSATSRPTYVEQSLDNGNPHSSCDDDTPCPRSNPVFDNAFLAVGGGATVNWTAPNAYPGQLPANTLQGLEDLAFWSEGGSTAPNKAFSLASGGQLNVRGVLFTPNGNWQMSSPTNATPRDSQYIARRLWLNQGNMTMQPSEGNAVSIPTPGTSNLIR
jgi:hypothetical protein